MLVYKLLSNSYNSKTLLNYFKRAERLELRQSVYHNSNVIMIIIIITIIIITIKIIIIIIIY